MANRTGTVAAAIGRRAAAALVLGLAALAPAQAFFVERFVPQGRIESVGSIKVRFNEPMVALGGQPSAPISLSCAPVQPQGPARWVSEREWELTFSEPLAAGVRCRADLVKDLKAVSGSGNTGPSQFAFNTGGPAVVARWPQGGEVDEQQVFLLRFNAEVDPASLAEHGWCQSDKVGETFGLVLAPPAVRDAVILHLKSTDARADPALGNRLQAVQCARPLGAESNVKIVVGAGVRTKDGLARSDAQTLSFRTRPAFRVTASCEREREERPCIPLKPIELRFSTEVRAALASQVRLVGPKGAVKPQMHETTRDSDVVDLRFPGPFEPNAEYRVELPADFEDVYGRKPANAAAFPLKVATGGAPALAKFSARFGIVERSVGALPVTVRKLAGDLQGRQGALLLRGQQAPDDAAVARLLLVARAEEQREFALRAQPLLALGRNQDKARALPLPQMKGDTEVIGIPLAAPGLHLVELESKLLGQALLDADAVKAGRPLYVRALALVTGMAVHFKTSGENAALWVTSLETGRPVEGADLRVSDCNGKLLWQGRSDAQGQARIAQPLAKAACRLDPKRLAADFGIADAAALAPFSGGEREADAYDLPRFLIASARKDDDYAFALSDWTRGIEPWRFNVRMAGWRDMDEGDEGGRASRSDTLLAHTILPRHLLRQGETVQMKHLLRRQVAAGLARPAARPAYDRVQLTHAGSNQSVELPLAWLSDASATSEWRIPAEAKLGRYGITLLPAAGAGNGVVALEAGEFQVAQFRVPTMQGSIAVLPAAGAAPGAPLAGLTKLPLALQLGFLNGGPAAGASVQVSALLRPWTPNFPAYPEVSFMPPISEMASRVAGIEDGTVRERLLLDKAPVKLDAQGGARFELKLPAPSSRLAPDQLRVEFSYRDPNGEIQTIAQNFTLWPAKLALGVRNAGFGDEGGASRLQLVAVDLQGKPQGGVAVEVKGYRREHHTLRKRAVGGFYAYEHRTEQRELGVVCSGKTDAQGSLDCALDRGKLIGDVLLVARAKDADGNTSTAGSSMWFAAAGEIFKPDDSDRFDLLADKRRVAPGETVRLQARLPFDRATAWVAVEREGIVDTFVTELTRDKPTIELQARPDWTPNVFVSVLALRPRLQPLSWWSFFEWGWKSPRQWWQARKKSREPPTAMVDLAKPAFRLGMVELEVPPTAKTLKVEVAASPAVVQTREEVRARVAVASPDGKPLAAGASVALAVVDEALLELAANPSWDLVDALWQKRGYGVETATAQMQVIGKRHFGLKAQPPGGGGGRRPARELLDTLAYWNPNVVLDAQGRAEVAFKVNDSLTKFRVVALAEAGDGLFGTGHGFVTVTRDVQLLSGLPPLVRDEDVYGAAVTLRNGTARPLKLRFVAQRQGKEVHARELELAPQAAGEVVFEVRNQPGERQIEWLFDAREVGAPPAGARAASDQLRVVQTVQPSVRNAVWAASLVRLDGPQSLPVAEPAGALTGRSAVRSAFSASLVGALEPVRAWWADYPFACLEQRVSKAIGLRDAALWKVVVDGLPNYLDGDGLAGYYPGEQRLGGSDVLTAYVLSAAHEGGLALPSEPRERMLAALVAFVDGKLRREYWAPRADLSERRLIALEALARYQRAGWSQLASVGAQPNQWPTSAVIDWLALLQRLEPPAEGRAQHERWLAEAVQVLRARLSVSGTRIVFDDERRDHLWWLMVNGDVNAARLLLLAMEGKAGIAEWQQDLPRLVAGLVGRQQRGVWTTTSANLWGALALEKYARQFERQPVAGSSMLQLQPDAADKPPVQGQSAWRGPQAESVVLPLAGTAQARLSHQGSGRPYATVQVLASVPEAQPVAAGYAVRKTLVPVTQRVPGRWSRGDVLRVDIEIEARAPMSLVALHDPVPSGATLLGSGLRDSAADLAKAAAAAPAPSGGSRWSSAWLAYEERAFDGYRAYWDFVPAGKTSASYTLRLNQPGEFTLPSTRVEAMYAPEVFGSLPNARFVVQP